MDETQQAQSTSSHAHAWIAIALVLAILVSAGAWYWQGTPPLFTKQEAPSIQMSYDPEVVTAESTQIGEFTGYYQKFERESEVVESPQTCHGIVVETGNSQLVEYFLDTVRQGNTVNAVVDNKLRLNIPWHEIPADARARLEASTPVAPVTVVLQKKVESGMGVGPCFSFFSYVSLK